MIDSTLAFEVLLIVGLMLLNGVFAMSEIAVVSSRKARLRQHAESGQPGARRALDLAEHPTRFLSTVQIGITLVGVFAGAYGGVSIAGHLDSYLARWPALAPHSEKMALGAVVVAITFLSLVVGELVPKRIALNNPERIAATVAGPMHALATIGAPLVTLLEWSTDAVLRLLRIRKSSEPPVTEEELTALLHAGAAAGVFEEEEQELVEGVFRLGDQRVGAIMTPRRRVSYLDVRDSADAARSQLIRERFSYYPVCEGGLDQVLGLVSAKDLMSALLAGKEFDLRASLRKPLFVPESLEALRLLDLFRETGLHTAIVIDEYGGVEGVVTLTDVLAEITGDLLEHADSPAVQRDDGSWLIDGSLLVDEFIEILGLQERRFSPREYRTVGGLVLAELGRIPRSGDVVTALGVTLEVVDMDGHRVDKVIATTSPGPPPGA